MGERESYLLTYFNGCTLPEEMSFPAEGYRLFRDTSREASAAAQWEPPGVGSRALWDLASTHLSLCGDCVGLSLRLGVSRTEDVWGHQVLLSGFRRFLSRAM